MNKLTTINQSAPCKVPDLKMPPTNAQIFRCSELIQCGPTDFPFLVETANLSLNMYCLTFIGDLVKISLFTTQYL